MSVTDVAREWLANKHQRQVKVRVQEWSDTPDYWWQKKICERYEAIAAMEARMDEGY